MGQGIWYARLEIELDVERDDFGHPEIPDLLEQIESDRPHGVGKFRCLNPACNRGVDNSVYLRTDPRSGRRAAVHLEPGLPPHDFGTPESDKHKAFKERIAKVGERIGAKVMLENSTGSRRVRTDVTLTIGERILGCEVQVSPLKPGTVAKRAQLAATAGRNPFWLTDHPSPVWIEKAPWTTVPPTTWHRVFEGTDLLVSGGVRVAVMERCGQRGPSCPKTGCQPCGQMHLHLDVARGVQLDRLVEDAATGASLSLAEPRSRGGFNYHWVSAADFDRFHNDRGFEPFNPVVRSRVETQGAGRWNRSCDELLPRGPQTLEPPVPEPPALFDLTSPTGTQYATPTLERAVPITDLRSAGSTVSWLSPCSCGHPASRHANTKQRNNAGRCRWSACSCSAFCGSEG